MQKLYSSKVEILYPAVLLLASRGCLPSASQQQACLVQRFYFGRIKFLRVERLYCLSIYVVNFFFQLELIMYVISLNRGTEYKLLRKIIRLILYENIYIIFFSNRGNEFRRFFSQKFQSFNVIFFLKQRDGIGMKLIGCFNPEYMENLK